MDTVSSQRSKASTLNLNSPELRARLDAIPTEELRVWSAWLTKVTEIAVYEYQEWLLSHINLALRLNECLLKARQEIELENLEESELRTEGSRTTIATDIGEGAETPRILEKSISTAQANELEKSQVTYDYTEGEDKASEKPSRSEFGTEVLKETASENLKSITSSRTIKTTDGEDISIIPIPNDEMEMLEFVKEFKRQAKKYQSLYRYWSETADRVIEEIVGKSVMLEEQVYTHEEIPYFFSLREEADVDIGIESDDEEILRSDGRERITCKNLHLFFNLTKESGSIENSSYEI